MRVSKFSLPVIIAGFVLTFLLTGSLSAKERGWYVHGGLSYWNDMRQWENGSYFVNYLPGFSTTGLGKDSSASQLSLGIGYNFNKNWAIEIVRGGVPDLIIPGTHWLIPPIGPDDEPVSASWVVSLNDNNFGVTSVIYDHYLSERVSLFLKVGRGTSGGAKEKLDSTLMDSHRELLDEQIPNNVLRSGRRYCDGCGLRAGIKVYAVGMRMPLFRYTKVSITVSYQFIRKDVRNYLRREWDEEAIPPLPPQTRQYETGTVKTSTFEIGIQLHL